MRVIYKLPMLLLAWLLLQSHGQAEEAAGQRDRIGGVYVYGYYVLDMNRAIESWVPANTTEVVDCSNAKFFCLRTKGARFGLINFVLPRKCVTIREGDSWQLAGLKTTVVKRNETRLGETFFLITVGLTDTIYNYRPNVGIVDIYHSFGPAVDVEKLNPEGPTPKGQKLMGFGRRLTFDNLAACNE